MKGNRLSWILFKGPIPEGMFVLHHCDNGACCNPDHLFIGDNSDNMRDRWEKGRYNTVPRGQEVNTCKLTPSQVIEIRRRISNGERMAPLSREFGVNKSAIRLIKIGRNWKHLL